MSLFDGQVVVVAGYGAGLGAALAERSAAEGAKVVIASRTAEKLEAAAEQLRGSGATVLTVPTDVEDEEGCEALVARTLETFGRVDVLFNNAFRMPPMDPLTRVDHGKIQ